VIRKTEVIIAVAQRSQHIIPRTGLDVCVAVDDHRLQVDLVVAGAGL
jgi:hypothetical protein